MKNIQIKTKVFTNRIILHIREAFNKNIDASVVADTIREILADDSMLDAIATVAWDEDGKKGICAFTPEQLLELAPDGFNPCPIDDFVSGELDLKRAIENCFSQTFHEAWSDECWEDNGGDDLEELCYDLFEVSFGEHKEDQWLATDKEGNALRDLCKECRGKADTENKEE